MKHTGSLDNVKKADFFPVSSLDDKRNYKRYFYIRPNGSILERIHLDVPDPAHREQLICIHYLLHLSHHFLGSSVGVNILGRDDPWDFTIELSSGDLFFVEITSIADSAGLFEFNTREERFARWVGQKMIPLHELRKLAHLFPAGNLQAEAARFQGRDDSDLVPNPLVDEEKSLFVGRLPEPTMRLSDLIRSAIEKKTSKPHVGKERAVLILDNRTGLFDMEDYRTAVDGLGSLLEGLPFREVWFYTGYCSDDDGNNAEFSFSPLKITPDQIEVLEGMEVDSKRRHVW